MLFSKVSTRMRPWGWPEEEISPPEEFENKPRHLEK
jgi:hypothetical protein